VIGIKRIIIHYWIWYSYCDFNCWSKY